jgi:hypothetical protein
MATGLTPNYSLHYPIPTDPVNVAGDVEQLAEDVDTALLNKASVLSGVPVGGTTGQVLSKVNSTDYNTQWTSQAFLEGLGYVSSRYYSTYYTSLANTNFTVNTTRYTPFYVSETATFDRMLIQSGSFFTGNTTVRLAIYNNSNAAPSTVVLDAGTVNVTFAATNYEITINQSLSKGWYWLAANTQSLTGVNGFATIPISSTLHSQLLGSSSPGGNQGYYTQSVNVSTGFTTASASLTFNTAYYIALRKS